MPFVDEERLQKVINYGLGGNEDCWNCPLEDSDAPCSKRLSALCRIDCSEALHNYLTENANAIPVENLDTEINRLESALRVLRQQKIEYQEQQRQAMWKKVQEAVQDYANLGGKFKVFGPGGETVYFDPAIGQLDFGPTGAIGVNYKEIE